jgi:Zn-dependent protease
MFRSWRLGRLFGIPLYIHPTFLIPAAWILFSAWPNGVFLAIFYLAWFLTTFACIVLHEYGHALMARLFGVGTRDITVYPIGGLARLERMPEQPAEELLIALAGPAVNLVIALLLAPIVVLGWRFGLLSGAQPDLSAGLAPVAVWFVLFVMVSNLILLVFNLLPAFPMDGGRVLRALLSLVTSRLAATEIAAGIGTVVAVLIGLVLGIGPAFVGGSINPWALLVALFVLVVGRMELAMVRRLAQQGPVVGDALLPAVVTAVGPGPAFSGFRWDRRSHVWVRWQDGRPVEVHGGVE